MLRNLDLFQLETLSHTTRRVALIGGGEAFPYSDLSVGRIDGIQRTIPALVSDGITDGDCWYIVNLVDNSNNMSRYVQSVAVLGATSEDQARDWALKNIGAFIGANDAWNTAFTSTKALITYLNRPSTSVSTIAIRQKDLDTIAMQITDKPVVWDGVSLVSHDPSSLLHELVKSDDCVQMMDAMTPDDLPVLMAEMGGELAEYDALIVDYNRLDLLMQRLNAAMQKSSFGNVKPVNVTQSKPFKKNGVTNVAALFEMSDGQSITIVFHSPDNTPAKLAPGDTLTSWKWMLNKRDISAAVAPANGQNVQLPDLAKRLLIVVEKNSARFTRANGNKAAQVQELTDTNTRIGQKQEALAGILADNKALQKQIDEAGKQAAQPPIDNSEAMKKAVDDFGKDKAGYVGSFLASELSDAEKLQKLSDAGAWCVTVYGASNTINIQYKNADGELATVKTPAYGVKGIGKIYDAYLLEAPAPAAKSKDLSNEKRVPLTDKDAANMPYEQYAKMVFNGQIANDLPPSSIKLNEQLTYQKQLLEDFNAKRISRTKILGTPKATDKDARDYLLKNINELEQAIATEGVSDDGIRANWEYAVKKYARQLGLRTDGKLIDDVLKDIGVQEQPPAQPASEPPMTNPDRDYLQSIIDGKADLSNGDDVEAKLTDISERLDAELEPLFEQAAEAFAQYAIAQAATV